MQHGCNTCEVNVHLLCAFRPKLLVTSALLVVRLQFRHVHHAISSVDEARGEDFTVIINCPNRYITNNFRERLSKSPDAYGESLGWPIGHIPCRGQCGRWRYMVGGGAGRASFGLCVDGMVIQMECHPRQVQLVRSGHRQ